MVDQSSSRGADCHGDEVMLAFSSGLIDYFYDVFVTRFDVWLARLVEARDVVIVA